MPGRCLECGGAVVADIEQFAAPDLRLSDRVSDGATSFGGQLNGATHAGQAPTAAGMDRDARQRRNRKVG